MLKKYDKLFSGGFFLAVAVVMYSQISKIRLTNIAMDSRLVPMIIAILLCIISIPLIILGLLELKTARRTPASRFDKKAALRIFLSLAMFAVFAFLLPLAGFIVAGIVFLLGSIFLLAPKEKWKIPVFLILSICIPASVYFLFTNVFRMLLPAGTLW